MNSMSSTQTQLADLPLASQRNLHEGALAGVHELGAVPAQRELHGTSQLAYRIADISFGMTARDGLRMVLDPALCAFAMPRTASDECDVNVNVSLVDELKVPAGKPLFE